jgi:hypothetical protein
METLRTIGLVVSMVNYLFYYNDLIEIHRFK